MSNQAKELTTERDLQAQLAARLMDLFDAVVHERKAHYASHPETIPSQGAIPDLIGHYSNENALISGGLSLIPGPWGIAAAIPEIILVIRNQLMLIYDVGMAYGQAKVLNKELLVGILCSSLGVGGIGLLTMQGGKVLVKRASLRVIQKILALLAGKVTQQMLKSVIAKWLPGVGAAAMAVWSRYSTSQIGKKAVAILSQPVRLDPGEADSPVPDLEPSPHTQDLKVLKLSALINLMKLDGEIASKEAEYADTLILNSGLDPDTVAKLCTMIGEPGTTPVDYACFSENPDEALGLMMDLLAMAKRDGEFHVVEKVFIKSVGKALGYSDEDVASMLTIES